MSEVALYECKKNCVFPVVIDEHGTITDKYFRIAEEAITKSDFQLQVPAGEIVCHHFKPADDQAREDREDQITNPDKYIETESDMGLIAEFMVDRGFYQDDVQENKEGKWVVKKIAKKVAIDSIRETIGDDVYKELVLGKDGASKVKDRMVAITEMLKLGDDAKSQRKALLKILADKKVTKGFFRGSPPEKLAEFIYEQGLYEG